MNDKKSWLDEIVDSTVALEPPERYWWWSGMAVLSAVIKDQVWLDRFSYKLYPNIYVLILSAKSGLRKGVPVSFAKRLLRKVDATKIITGQQSIQGVIKELSLQYTSPTGRVYSNAQGILVASELASSMTEDQLTWSTLTDLHNTHEHTEGWDKTLKGSAKETLKDLCLTLLLASNKSLMEETLKAKDIEGGFIARTFVVSESKRRAINALTERPELLMTDEHFVDHLNKIKDVKGEFGWTPEAKKLYKFWYTALASTESEDRTGTIERLGDQVLKAAMLIALSYGTELWLTPEVIQEAIDRCEECAPGVRMMESGSGRSAISPIITKLISLLVNAPDQTVTRRKMQRGLFPDADHMELDRALETMTAAGMVSLPIRDGKDIVYKMEEDAYNLYRQYKKEG